MRRRVGFTLMELMVVIAIIGILSSIFLGALSSASRLAKGTNTRALVQKIHNSLMSRWDSYRSVRLPIALEARGTGATANSSSESTSRFRQDVARRKMLAMRELLRMEMPDRYEDILTKEEGGFQPVYLVQPSGLPVRPFLWSAYRRKILDTKSKIGATDGELGRMSPVQYLKHIGLKNQSAECLYMIMTLGGEDSSTSTEHFNAKDFADTDDDGMLEFIDAWGMPIEFIRWAPGFVSPMQPMYSYQASSTIGLIFGNTMPPDPRVPGNIISRWKVQTETYTNTNSSTAATSQTRLVIVDQDDPFNPMRVGPLPDPPSGAWKKSTRWKPGDTAPEHGFLLMPLVYSRGDDMKSGMQHCFSNGGVEFDAQIDATFEIDYSPTAGDPEKPLISFSDPYNSYKGGGLTKVYRGSSRGDGGDLDNIHNHNLGTR